MFPKTYLEKRVALVGGGQIDRHPSASTLREVTIVH